MSQERDIIEPKVSLPAPVENTARTKTKRIIPWCMFLGSMVPNWLQRQTEISQGAKLCYGRLSQYAGEDGNCFPKQRTLAVELGVSERTAREYIRELIQHKLIESDQRGLKQSNCYFFLDHPWIHECLPLESKVSDQNPPSTSAQDRQLSSTQDRRNVSGPINREENQVEKTPEKRNKTHTYQTLVVNLPHTLEEAVEAAKRLGIEADFAGQEFYSKKSVGWRDGYGNEITSWPDHLMARWTTEQRKRSERHTSGRTTNRRAPQPPRQWDREDYNQPTTNF